MTVASRASPPVPNSRVTASTPGLGHLLALGAQALAHLAPQRRGVHQLHCAALGRRLVIAQDPDVGGDAGVEEHVGGQGDDGLHQVVLQHVAADLALARPGAAGEQRRAVQHDAQAAAAVLGRAHLADQVQQEQQRAVGDARQAGAEAAGMAHLLGLAPYLLLHLLPFHAKGRVGEHVVEVALGVAVLGQGVAGQDVADVLALDEHVRLADGITLVV